MNLDALRTKVSFLVNFNTGQADQDFAGTTADSNRDVDFAINEAYRDEVEKGKQNGNRNYFLETRSFTWPAGEQTQPIPLDVLGKTIIAFRDDTQLTPGPIAPKFDALVEGSGLFIVNRRTFGLQPAPGTARTFTILFLANAAEMKESDDEPELIQPQFHDLIVWSAAILLKQVADQRSPPEWLSKQLDYRNQWWKFLSLGSPVLHPPQRIRLDNPDITELF